MIRVLGGPDDPATRMENRSGEPATNPYLFFATQLIAGMDGVDSGMVPPRPETDPYNADNPMLPDNLSDALDAAAGSELLRREFGEIFMDYYVKLKQAELGRFDEYNEKTQDITKGEVTQWEQDEYFDFF